MTAKLQVSGDVLASAFDEELVLLDLRDGFYYGLEGVGSRIWSLIQNPTTIADLRDRLVEEYEVDADRCETDLRALLDELLKRGLAVVHPS